MLETEDDLVMSLAEELLADLEEDGFDESEPMIVQEEVTNELTNNTSIPKQTGIICFTN